MCPKKYSVSLQLTLIISYNKMLYKITKHFLKKNFYPVKAGD